MADLVVVGAMQRELHLIFVAIVFSTILVSSGCQKTAATNHDSQNKSESLDSTKPLQAVDLVGYNGTRLRNSVDRIKEASAKHNREMEEMVESGPDQQ